MADLATQNIHTFHTDKADTIFSVPNTKPVYAVLIMINTNTKLRSIVDIDFTPGISTIMTQMIQFWHTVSSTVKY